VYAHTHTHTHTHTHIYLFHKYACIYMNTNVYIDISTDEINVTIHVKCVYMRVCAYTSFSHKLVRVSSYFCVNIYSCEYVNVCE